MAPVGNVVAGHSRYCPRAQYVVTERERFPEFRFQGKSSLSRAFRVLRDLTLQQECDLSGAIDSKG